MDEAADQLTLAVVLREHLVRSGLPPDGGDSERFAVVKLLGRIPYPIPNTKARKRAVKIHDLNHLVTGYETDRKGELQISAWELGSGGCRNYAAAWTLDLAGLLAGLFLCPRLTARAFLVGRKQQNLYRYPLPELLALPLAEARSLVSRGPAVSRPRAPAALHLVGLGLLAVPVAAAMTVLWYIAIPIWLVDKGRAHFAEVPSA